ncbi:MAG: glycosyltransferase, partial [Acidobacteriia bacterium]|nr:glycosyltransferase [Terriglobia bacterium]
MTARIAAVITCRDLGRTLLEALTSIERQSRPAAEIVIVDDGSSQIYTRQILAQLTAQGVCVVQAGGRGASAARNLGARLTSAEIIVWLDADDILEPTYFEKAGAALDADPGLDFVSCAIRAFGEAAYIWTPASPTLADVLSNGAWPHASTMMRRRLWEAVGGFDETLPLFELLDFWTAALAQGFRGVVLEEALLKYRIRARSRYHHMIQPSTYVSRLAHFYAKHRTAIAPHGLAIIVGKEAFFLSQRDYHETLEARAKALEAELAQLQSEIADVARQLESQGAPRVGRAELAGVQPISRQWGRDRGTAIDRHYIERFLQGHRADIRGHVLEVRQPMYVDRFGGNAVTARDVIDVDPTNPCATVVADLRHAAAIPSATYDCIILTQTLHEIDDMAAVLAECARMLRPGGVLLATVPSVSKVGNESGLDGDFWRLTEASARKLFAGAFPVDHFDVKAHGNVRACAAFLYGMSAEEISADELDYADSAFPLLIAIRAVKPNAPAPVRTVASGFSRTSSAAILCYHRVAALTPDSHALCTPPDEFRAHMACLARDFHPIGLEELVRAAASGRIPERA